MNTFSLRPEIFYEAINGEAEMRRVQYTAICQKVGKALDAASGLTETDPPWLHKMVIKGRRAALDEDEVKCAFLEAAKSPDTDLFRRASSADFSPLDDSKIKNLIANKAEWALLQCWVAPGNEPLFKSLCYYTDKALARVIDFALGQNDGNRNEKAIRKVWERLGLEKAPHLLFRDVEIINPPRPGQASLIPIPYKKLIQKDG